MKGQLTLTVLTAKKRIETSLSNMRSSSSRKLANSDKNSDSFSARATIKSNHSFTSISVNSCYGKNKRHEQSLY